MQRLDLLEEKMEQALIQMTYSYNQIVKCYNEKVQWKEFKLGQLVLQRVFQNTKDHGAGKFGANWEDSYRVTAIVKRCVYKLETLSGQEVARSWNLHYLQKYYVWRYDRIHVTILIFWNHLLDKKTLG